MRIIFFLFPFWCFGQLNLGPKKNINPFPFQIDTTIQGDWYLMESLVRPEFAYDSIPIMRFEEQGVKRITFTKDSLFIHPWSTRYYKRTEKYNYEINEGQINLFSGLKKKRKQIGQIQIIRCTPEVLILSISNDVSDPLGNRSLTTHYIYYRDKDYKAIVSKFYGAWKACDDEFIDLLRDGGQSELTLFRDTVCGAGVYSLDLNFRRNETKINEVVEVSMSSQYSGVFLAGIEFYIDSKKKFVYFSSNEMAVYNYEFLDSRTLHLIYNQEESNRLKVK